MNYHYLISALIITLIIPTWDILIYLLNKLLYMLLSKITSEKAAMTIVNWLTIPGVIHHEISHAFLAIVTGAVVTEFRPFWPDRTTGSLGHVNFMTRGSLLVRSIQYTLTSAAPVMMGTITSLILFALARKTLPITTLIILIYLIFSILIHSSMSFADVKVMLRGIWVLYIGLLIFCIHADLDIVQFVLSRFA
ncbi:MAG: hypothetical protein J5959_00560 [Butyrivibrio sp.]|nr:hypothetical protein [Butyrivibrio sp.]